MTNFSITPTRQLLQQWNNEAIVTHFREPEYTKFIATRAAQWGADQELEACCKWLNGGSEIDYDTAALLRTARRPKPPSLKEQALQALAKADLGSTEAEWSQRFDTIRRALEQLDD